MANIVFEALWEGLQMLWEYVSEHTVTCLVPAFFIAGAIAAFVKKDAIMRYLGPRVPKRLSYSIAAVSGSVLAVCSCTILPLFAGIKKKGAGIGPASAFLYAGPAINILAIVFTASALGLDLGLARAVAAIALSVVVGLAMAAIFGREEKATPEEGADQVPVATQEVAQPHLEDDGMGDRPRWITLSLFVTLVAILVVGTTRVPLIVKVPVLLALIGAVAYLAWTYLARNELEDWGYETWDLTKKILPILLAGAFVVGIVAYFVPPETFSPYMGDNGVGAVSLAAVIGGILYMPTLLEVPIVGDTFGYTEGAMAGGPALALLLAGPAISLPNMIVLYKLIGPRKTTAYIAIVVIVSIFAGLLYGAIAG